MNGGRQIIFDGANLLVEAFQSFESGKTKVKCTGMSEKFNPLSESCQEACVRAVDEELKASVHVRDFCTNPLLANVGAGSQKFKGLVCEYHLYYCALSAEVSKQWQEDRLPMEKITAVAELDSVTNPKTLWWGWAPDISAEAVQDKLQAMTNETGDEDQADRHSLLLNVCM